MEHGLEETSAVTPIFRDSSLLTANGPMGSVRLTWAVIQRLPIRSCISGIILVSISACATVDPSADYLRTRGFIKEQTGVLDVFDPTSDEVVDDQIQKLFQEGLTIDEASGIALLNNKGLQSLFQEIGIARADVVQSGLLTNPTLSFGVRFPEGGGRSELTAGLAQQIVDLWQIPVRKRIAQSRLEQTVFLVTRRAQELVANVHRAYYHLIAVDRALALTREHAELAKKSLDVAQTRLDLGEADPFELNLARGSLLDIRVDLAKLEGDREVAEIALARSLGLSRSDAPWTLSTPLPQPRSLTLQDVDLVGQATTERLDVQRADFALQAAEDEFVRQCRNVFPSIVLGITGERTERRSLPDRDVLADTARSSIAAGQLTAPGIQSRSQRAQERSQFIDALLGATVSMTLPIWDQNQAGIAKARFGVIQKRKELEDLQNDIGITVSDALSRARTSATIVSLYETEIKPNDSSNIEGARTLYEAGEHNILVLLDAQEALIQHQRRYVDGLKDYSISIVDLELALGGPLGVIDEQSSESQEGESQR